MRLAPRRNHGTSGTQPAKVRLRHSDPELAGKTTLRVTLDVCKGTYALTVPFMKLFFALAKDGERAGWVGQITSNSFMKREFGTKLIEDFLSHRDLRLVVDSAGAYIPGHGTPTAIIVGRNQPSVGSTVRAALGIRGEPGRPDDPAKGIVWASISEHVDQPGWEDGWITIADLDRGLLAYHPWSLTGGGAVDLMNAVTSSEHRKLGEAIAGKIGFASFPGADDVFFAPRAALRRTGVPDGLMRAVITGDVVRDWRVNSGEWALVPYDQYANLVALDAEGWGRRQWPLRTVLGGVTGFGGETRAEAGEPWWGWYRWVAQRYLTPLSITFAFVATHNHFVLDRGGKVFKQSAPVIKLPIGATEDEHLALLGLLNSSTACFWLKQSSHNKGEGGGARVDAGYAARGEPFRETYEFTGTTLEDYPLPAVLPLEHGYELDALACELFALGPAPTASELTPTLEGLAERRDTAEQIRGRLIALQEELDWEVYRLYGLTEEDLTSGGENLPALAPGERAFEIVLARAVEVGAEETTWFTHPDQCAVPITEIPEHWPAEYRELVQRRLDKIASDPFIKLLERPEYKRRWAQEPWEKRQERALRNWLLDRLEDRKYWFDSQGRPRPHSVAQLADEVTRDADLTSVLALWEGQPDVPVTHSLVRLLADEAVPFLAAYRYKDTGLRKRQVWEETWALQRREDAGENIGTIPVPPKYTSADFRKASYWHARGKLDVPKERFILYLDAGRETDPTPLLGWAGWDHAQQSLALSVIITEREKDGWADERLVPLVAGLAELQPWLDQWHGAVDPAYGLSLAAFCREQLTSRAAQVGKTLAQLAEWKPEPSSQGRRPRASRNDGSRP